jgi:predicted permease
LKLEEFLLSAKTLNFYATFHPDISLIGHAPPRATGYSRMLAILTIFLIAWVEKKKNTIKNPTTYLVFFLATTIWLFQSRGTYLCYIVSTLCIIFILNHKNNLYRKITKFFLYIFVPIVISFLLSILFSTQNLKFPDTNIENSIENSSDTNMEMFYLTIEFYLKKLPVAELNYGQWESKNLIKKIFLDTVLKLIE